MIKKSDRVYMTPLSDDERLSLKIRQMYFEVSQRASQTLDRELLKLKMSADKPDYDQVLFLGRAKLNSKTLSPTKNKIDDNQSDIKPEE